MAAVRTFLRDKFRATNPDVEKAKKARKREAACEEEGMPMFRNLSRFFWGIFVSSLWRNCVTKTRLTASNKKKRRVRATLQRRNKNLSNNET